MSKPTKACNDQCPDMPVTCDKQPGHEDEHTHHTNGYTVRWPQTK